MSHAQARFLYHLRRLLGEHHALLVCAGALVLLARGGFADLRPDLDHALALAAAGVMAALLLGRLLKSGMRPPQQAPAPRRSRLQTGLLALTAVYVAIQTTGGPASRLQPLAYLMVALLVGFFDALPGLALCLAAVTMQALLHLAAGELPANPQSFLVHTAFIVAFSLANSVLLQMEVALRRHESKKILQAEIRAMREEARDFRLISSALTSSERRDRAADEAKLAQGGVEAIHQGMYFVLELLKRSLDLQTCVLLWLDNQGQSLCIKELVTESSMVREIPMSVQAGVLGGVVKNRILLNLRRPPHGARGIPYYGGPEQVGSFIGVPVLEDGHLRGVLCADRREDRLFTESEEQLMLAAARQVLRAIQTERVFCAVERAKYEHERFYGASALLNSALTLSEVYDTAFAAAEEIARYDLGAITLYDPERRRHVICRVRGDAAPQLEGESFASNAGLVSMVVKNKHHLPAGSEIRERDTVVFTRKLRLRGMESLVVLPLIVKDEAIGTFVLASRHAGAFGQSTREMLGVITNQVAVAVENAKMYRRMEEMATTDGLTGLPNHRTFQGRLSEMLHRAERHRKQLSVVLTDIDRFKLVNDTYGHPTGDAVLRRVAHLLAGQVRKVDLVARYGGEEFVMVLEETDPRGAHLFCERVRQELAAQLMSSDKGPFRVTLSLGIASYPADGQDKAQLIERADQALYAAKQDGRNRTVRWADLQHVRTVARPS